MRKILIPEDIKVIRYETPFGIVDECFNTIQMVLLENGDLVYQMKSKFGKYLFCKKLKEW